MLQHLHVRVSFTLMSNCRAQKTSLWAWALGSVCTIVSECYELSQLSKPPSTKEGQEAWEIKRMKAQAEMNSRMIVLIHALFQVSAALTWCLSCSVCIHRDEQSFLTVSCLVCPCAGLPSTLIDASNTLR